MFPLILSLIASGANPRFPHTSLPVGISSAVVIKSLKTTQKSGIKYDGQCFTINGKDLYLYSGAFHYFRCPKPLWRDRLQKIKEAHFNCIETYVAWNVHEPREGRINLTEFEDFLRLCESMGFYVIARPGPYICAEWDAGGFPTWLPAKVKSLRDNSEDSVKWSRHWFDAVLPVIRRHQIQNGGTIILCQLENEYDYHPGVSDAEKKEYVRSLYKMAKANGIEVPLITCWTRQVRDRNDPDMKQIMDSCNFYPNWGVGGTVGSLEQLGREQPDAPRMVTELQGGWFSGFGGKLSVDQPGITAAQENALIKTVWEGGATATNYYMLFGGTNFGYWGAKGMTTTYDYAAPLREPGGLWDKYYTVRAAGRFLEQFGSLLVRSELLSEGASTSLPDVHVAERANGSTGYLFVRNDSDSVRDGFVTATDPATRERFDVSVHLEPRGAKVLPVNLPLKLEGGLSIQRSNAEILGSYKMGKQNVLIAYGDPGESLQITFGKETGRGEETGKTVGANLPAAQTGNPDQLVAVPGGPLVLFTTSARAARLSEVPGDGGSFWPVSGGFYRVHFAGATDDRMGFDAEVAAGTYETSIPLPRKPIHLRVNGVETPVNMVGNMAKFRVSSGGLDIPRIALTPIRVNKEMWGGGTGWKPASFNPLDMQGILDNGYTRYRTLFTWKGEKELVLSQYAGDPVLVSVNGIFVNSTSGSNGTIRVDLTKVAKQGINRVEALYENAGRPNFGGAGIWERKGLKSAQLLMETDRAATLDQWRFQRSGRPSDRSPEMQPGFDDSGWKTVGIGNVDDFNNYRGWGWFRTTLNVSPADIAQGRVTLSFEGVDDNAIVYVNGKRLGEHKGWSEPFSLNGNFVLQAGPNTIAIAVENTDGPGGIFKPVSLTAEQIGEPLKGWELADRLSGQLRGWQKDTVPGTPWFKAVLPERRTERTNTVRWYRTSFRLPDPKATRFHAPWKLKLDAGGEALIYVNGTLIGRYSDRGPQTEFFLPECWLRTGAKPNIVAIAVRDGTQAAALRSLSVLPYTEYATRRIPVTVDY